MRLATCVCFGGVAPNCVVNGLIQKKIFDKIWIQLAAGDACFLGSPSLYICI